MKAHVSVLHAYMLDACDKQLCVIARLTFSRPSGLPVMMQVGSENVLPPSTCTCIASHALYALCVCEGQAAGSIWSQHTECLYALTLYLPVLVGKQVSATYFVMMRDSVESGLLPSAVTLKGVACKGDCRFDFRFRERNLV